MNLTVKLAVTVAAISMLCATVIAGFSYQIKRDNIELDIQRSLMSLGKTVFNTATAAAYVGDEGLAQEVILGLESNNLVACADIQFGDGLLPATKESKCLGDPDHQRTLLSPFDGAETVGQLHIYQDHAEASAILKSRLIHEARTIAAILLFVSIATLLATYSFVTRPVHNLSSRLENIDLSKERPQALEASARKDEIGAISRVIDLLLRNAAHQIQREKLLNMQSQLMSENFKMTFDLSQT